MHFIPNSPLWSERTDITAFHRWGELLNLQCSSTSTKNHVCLCPTSFQLIYLTVSLMKLSLKSFSIYFSLGFQTSLSNHKVVGSISNYSFLHVQVSLSKIVWEGHIDFEITHWCFVFTNVFWFLFHFDCSFSYFSLVFSFSISFSLFKFYYCFVEGFRPEARFRKIRTGI